MKDLLPIESEICRIREFVDQDIPLLANIEFDPEVKSYVGVPKGTKEQWIARARSNLGLTGYAIESISKNELAGRVNLHRAENSTPGTAEIQIIINKKFWGQKFGKEVTELILPIAFKELQAKSVIAEVHPRHNASLSLLQAFGFQYVGTSPKQPRLIYEITKDEFNKNGSARKRQKTPNKALLVPR